MNQDVLELVGSRTFYREGAVVELSHQAPALASVLPTWVRPYVLRFPLDAKEWEPICELSVDALLREPDQAMGTWLPTLSYLYIPLTDREFAPLDVTPLERRVHNALLEEFLGDRMASLWGDLGDFTVSDIAATRGVGAARIRDVVRFLVDLAVRVDPNVVRHASPKVGEPWRGSVAESPLPLGEKEECLSPDVPKGPEGPQGDGQFGDAELQVLRAPLSRVMEWAASELGSVTIFDALRAASQGPAPDDVKEVARIAERTRVPILPTSDISALIDDFLDREFDSRRRLIFRARILKPQGATLEEMGSELGLTRERVRQIEKVAQRDALKALSSEKYRVLRWRSHTLRKKLGPLFPDGHPAIYEILEEVLGRQPSPDHWSFLLWAAGPYELINGLWGLEGSRVRRYLEADIFQSSDELGIPKESLISNIVEYGVPEDFAEGVLQATPKLHELQGRYFTKKPSIPDRCALALHELGRPTSIAHLAELIGSEGKLRNLVARVQADERFARVSKDEYALRDWDLEEYNGIVDAMAKMIVANGGSIDTARLVHEIPEAFGVSPTSVKMYFDAPIFVVEGDSIRLRREDEGFTVDDQLHSRRGVFKFDRRLTILVGIDEELIRGSGKPIMPDIVHALGVRPGSVKTFYGDDLKVGVHWPRTSWSGGSLGSLRAAVGTTGGQLGQQLRLTFNLESSSVEAVAIDSTTLLTMPALEGLRHLTGVKASSSLEAISALDSALGDSLVGASALLRVRGDEEAATLVERLELG